MLSGRWRQGGGGHRHERRALTGCIYSWGGSRRRLEGPNLLGSLQIAPRRAGQHTDILPACRAGTRPRRALWSRSMADDLAEYVEGTPAGVTPGQVRGHLVEAERLARYWWAAGLMAGVRVLDLGCGLGDGSAILLEAGATEVVGVDAAAARSMPPRRPSDRGCDSSATRDRFPTRMPRSRASSASTSASEVTRPAPF